MWKKEEGKLVFFPSDAIRYEEAILQYGNKNFILPKASHCHFSQLCFS